MRPPSEYRLRLLAAVGDGKVSRYWVTRNSAPDVPGWVVGGQHADAIDAAALTYMSQRGWIVTDAPGWRWVRLTDEGREVLREFWPLWRPQAQQRT